jgi:hypothetical protein
MYSEIVQTAILLTLLWMALTMWGLFYVGYKIVKFFRFIQRPRTAFKVTRRDFNLPFLQYVVANLFIRYILRKRR